MNAGVSSSLPLIFVSIACGVCGQLALKVGMTQLGRIGGEALAQPTQVALRVATNPLVLAGLGMYAISAMVWLTVLSRVPLSFAYPIVALSYAIVPVLAWLLLGETVPAARWLGIATICLGVFLISRS